MKFCGFPYPKSTSRLQNRSLMGCLNFWIFWILKSRGAKGLANFGKSDFFFKNQDGIKNGGMGFPLKTLRLFLPKFGHRKSTS